MPIQAALSEADYIRTSVPDVDREFRDGEVFERSVPNNLHGKVAGNLAGLLWQHRDTLPVFLRVDTRVRTRPGRYLIPDVSVYWPSEPVEEIPESRPLIVAEILSPDDRMSEVRAKLAEYFAWGVPHVWLVDPASRVLYAFDGVLREVDSYRVPEAGLTLTAAEILG